MKYHVFDSRHFYGTLIGFALPLAADWPDASHTHEDVKQEVIRLIRKYAGRQGIRVVTRHWHFSPRPIFVPPCIEPRYILLTVASVQKSERVVPLPNGTKYEYEREPSFRRDQERWVQSEAYNWWSREPPEQESITVLWESIDCEENRQQRFEGAIGEWTQDPITDKKHDYGFLSCAEYPRVFVHIRDFPKEYQDNIMQGIVYKVRFRIVNTEKGMRARNVEIVGIGE